MYIYIYRVGAQVLTARIWILRVASIFFSRSRAFFIGKRNAKIMPPKEKVKNAENEIVAVPGVLYDSTRLFATWRCIFIGKTNVFSTFPSVPYPKSYNFFTNFFQTVCAPVLLLFLLPIAIAIAYWYCYCLLLLLRVIAIATV